MSVHISLVLIHKDDADEREARRDEGGIMVMVVEYTATSSIGYKNNCLR